MSIGSLRKFSLSVIASLVVACGGPTAPAPGGAALTATPEPTLGASETITLYSGFDKNSTDAIVADFQKRVPQVKVTVFQSPIGELAQKIELEIRSSGRIQADVIATGDRTYFDRYRQAGVLQPYKPKGFDKIPELLRDKDGYWAAFILTGIYLVYNTNVVTANAAPRSWKDLENPVWKGKIALADPAVSGTAALLTAALAQKYGWSFWENVAKNNPKVLPSTVSLTTSVVTGERPIAPITSSPVVTELKKGSPVKLVVPSEGVPYSEQIAGITAKTEKIAASRALVDYLLSLEAATILSGQGRQSARVDAPAVPGVPSLTEAPPFPVDWALFAKESATVAENFQRAMGK